MKGRRIVAQENYWAEYLKEYQYNMLNINYINSNQKPCQTDISLIQSHILDLAKDPFILYINITPS